jgi:hypothetical protein
LACLPLVHVVGQVHCFSVRLLIRGIHVMQPCVLVPVTACASSPVPGDKKQLRAACCILCIMFSSIRMLVVSMVASQVRRRDLGSNPCSHTAACAMKPLLVLIFSPATTSALSQSLHAVTCPVVTTATGFLPHHGQESSKVSLTAWHSFCTYSRSVKLINLEFLTLLFCAVRNRAPPPWFGVVNYLCADPLTRAIFGRVHARTIGL